MLMRLPGWRLRRWDCGPSAARLPFTIVLVLTTNTLVRSVALCALLCSIASAQDLSKPVTYTTPAVPLHKALDAISAQTGLKLFASDELEDPIEAARKSGHWIRCLLISNRSWMCS